MEKVVQVSGLTHFYGENRAINDLNFEVNRGEVFGLLGPNGAGKTTTVRLLNGMFEPNQGEIRVLGLDPATQGAVIREKAGVLTETPALYERLTARQNLRFFGVLAGLSDAEVQQRTEELLGLFGLAKRADDRTGAYSKGMKQRLALARAWLTNPKILFLDEPTSGLDPEAAVQVRELISDVRQKEGTTVLICTHNLDEAQRLCDRLLVMRQGTSVAQGSLQDLRRLVSAGLWVDFSFLEPVDFASFNGAAVPGLIETKINSDTEFSAAVQDEKDIPEVIETFVKLGARIIRVQPREISLENIYLQLQNGGGLS